MKLNDSVKAVSSCRMLIVEDDLWARNSLKDILSKKYPHLTLYFAEDGAAGLSLFKTARPEIVLTDLNMPKMDGLQMAQEIRRLAPQVQVIVLTASNDSSRIIESMRHGISRYVLKPIEVRQLFEAVDTVLHYIGETTAHRIAEEARVRSEQRLQHALASAQLGAWEYSIRSGEILWDDRCRAMFGVEEEGPVPYAAALQHVHPLDRFEVHEALQRAASGIGGGTYQKEHRIVSPAGEVRWVASHGRWRPGDHDEDGDSIIGITMDITDRVHARDEISEREARYQALFDSLQEGVSLLEAVVGNVLEFRFIEVNPAFETMVGEGRRNLLGRSISEVIPDLDEEFLGRLAQVATTRVPATMDHYSRTWDRSFETRIYSPSEGKIAIVYADVTERRKLQEEREKNERLTSLGVLAGGIAHDFNNILTAIAGNLSLARFKLEAGQSAEGRLEECEAAVTKAAGLTRQLLTFAKGGEPIKKALRSEPLIREAVSFFLSGTNCKPRLALPHDLWSIDADAGQIQQVLNNLILNATQAMPRGGEIAVSAVNQVVVADDDLYDGKYVRITIADQGEGIPPDLLPRIFDPYFTTKPTGSGLGLTSVFSIVKRHRGKVTVSSAPGVGTSFELLIPAAPEEAQERDERRVVPASLEGREVLVMDDEEPIRTVASRMLEAIGYQVTTCCGGEEAVDLYRTRLKEGNPFSAVLLDMTVPGGMGGKDAAVQIRGIDPEARLVISSGYFSEAMSEWQGDVVVNGMVAKPYNLEQLSEELTRVMTVCSL